MGKKPISQLSKKELFECPEDEEFQDEQVLAKNEMGCVAGGRDV